MPDLIITYQNLSRPPDACAQEPPAPSKATPEPKDDCFFNIPLVEESHPEGEARMIRFDRKGSVFVLSPNNKADDLTWVGNQGNLSKVTDILRIPEAVMLESKNSGSEGSFVILLTIAQYIMTGRVRFKSLDYNPEIKGSEGNALQLASYLLEVFTYNPDSAVKKLLGVLTFFRGDSAISKDASQRIAWISDVLALRPSYKKFRQNFSKMDFLDDAFEKIPEDQKKNVAWLFAFCRQVVIQHSMNLPFKYDETFVNAFKAFLALRPKDSKDEEGDFCVVLETALKELGEKVPTEFRRDCLAAFQLVQMKPEAAIKQSMKRSLLDEEGRKYLQVLVQKESSQANMSVQWLFGRQRLGEVVDIFTKNLKVQPPKKPGDSPVLTLDFDKVSSELSLLISTNFSIQREYILSSVAILRRLFDKKGNPLSLHVFYNGSFADLPFQLSSGTPSDVKDLSADIERKLKLSEKHSEKWLPLTEALTCGAGIGGWVFSEGILKKDRDLQYGVGVSSAGIAGAGCSALAGHYLWPKIGKVRNRYLWEGLTGAGGAIAGVLIYSLVKSFSSSNGDPTKYPMDEYGP